MIFFNFFLYVVELYLHSLCHTLPEARLSTTTTVDRYFFKPPYIHTQGDSLLENTTLRVACPLYTTYTQSSLSTVHNPE